MLSRSVWLLALLSALASTGTAVATTGEDLSARVVIDGHLAEYAGDEWVLDPSSPFPEPSRDSSWGSDNDIRRVAVTWDLHNLYIAVDCVTLDSELFVFIDHTAGGIDDLRSLSSLRRNIVLDGVGIGFHSDLLVHARPEHNEPDVYVFGDGAPRALDRDAIDGRFVQFAGEGGALEVAVPWALVSPDRQIVGVVAAISGGNGTGCGDAAPDAFARLSTVRTDAAVLDRPLRVLVDAGGDGIPDVGLSPRNVSPVEGRSLPAVADDAELTIEVEAPSFSPDLNETLSFRIVRESGTNTQAFVSARVYSRSGRLVRVLFEDERRELDVAELDQWDGTDNLGRPVTGGIYILNVTWGAARGSRAGSTSTAVAVVR